MADERLIDRMGRADWSAMGITQDWDKAGPKTKEATLRRMAAILIEIERTYDLIPKQVIIPHEGTVT